ncbi:MAG: hypothetical protein WBA74_12730, partial [Cyclobacteriaceae bacterium]
MKRLMMIWLLVLVGFHSGAQEAPGIKVLGKATRRSVQLRWAPDSPVVWDLANKYGYTVERVKLLENGRVLTEPVKEIITDVVLKPAPQPQWVPFLDTDDYVAVAAQAIYGETFELSDDFNSDLSQIVDKAKELDNRFSFGLFAADQSVKAAELSGLYIEDELIAANTKYVYRVYANIPPDIVQVDTGTVYIG